MSMATEGEIGLIVRSGAGGGAEDARDWLNVRARWSGGKLYECVWCLVLSLA